MMVNGLAMKEYVKMMNKQKVDPQQLFLCVDVDTPFCVSSYFVFVVYFCTGSSV